MTPDPSEAVRRRIRARWERRRAETDGEVLALTSWYFDGRYSYPLGYRTAIAGVGQDSLTASQKALIYIKRAKP